MAQLLPLPQCHSLSLASVKSRLVLPFWYRLTWVVPEKGPLNARARARVCVCACVCYLYLCYTYYYYYCEDLLRWWVVSWPARTWRWLFRWGCVLVEWEDCSHRSRTTSWPTSPRPRYPALHTPRNATRPKCRLQPRRRIHRGEWRHRIYGHDTIAILIITSLPHYV